MLPNVVFRGRAQLLFSYRIITINIQVLRTQKYQSYVFSFITSRNNFKPTNDMIFVYLDMPSTSEQYKYKLNNT